MVRLLREIVKYQLLNCRSIKRSFIAVGWKSYSTLERLNGSFLTHSELQLHFAQGTVTLEAKYFMTCLECMCQIHRRS
jgi:hypothetical protein